MHREKWVKNDVCSSQVDVRASQDQQYKWARDFMGRLETAGMVVGASEAGEVSGVR